MGVTPISDTGAIAAAISQSMKGSRRRWITAAPAIVALASLEAPAEDEKAADPGEKRITWLETEKWPTLSPIRFALPEFPGNAFLLIFPEWLTYREQNWHVRPTWTTRRNEATAEWQSEQVELQLVLTLKSRRTGPSLEWTCEVTNRSGRDLTDAAVFNCFNLVEAPAFLDLDMTRTWVRRREKNTARLSEVRKTRGERTIQFYPAKGGLNLPEFERFSRYGATSPEALDGDRIAIVSRDAKWTVESIVDGKVAYFFNNWESDHGCIHAAPLLGNIPAGESAKATGRIRFSRIDSEE